VDRAASARGSLRGGGDRKLTAIMKQTSFEEFMDLSRRGTFVPVVREIIADLLTPVSAFLKIAEHSDYAFLFESVEGGEQVARYSFLGKDPLLVLRARGSRTSLERSGTTTETDEAFVPALRRLMAELQAPFVPGLPRFTGGAVGFIGYDASPIFEPVLQKSWASQGAAKDDARDPEDDAGFMLFDTVLAFDHVKHRILIIANARITAEEDLRALYQFACAKIDFLERELERGLSQAEPDGRKVPDVRSNQTREVFEAGVRSIKERIAAGDIYQAVLSQRFETDVTADPFTVYRALRHVNPSPYMYFIRMGPLAIVGSSPEMLVRVEGRRVETHPIAGTRPRGANEEEDLRLAEELKRNEKERAEHVMLVDLGRNDLGRVCEYGSVRVPQYMALERYSHVMHLVSTVDGRLAEGRDHLDALVACFPAGTVSGAPKIRAMQILSELEPTRREIYAGAIGYLDFAGNLDFCIAIRTITIRDGRAHVQAGAGIVADSNPAAEYEETRDKARALLQALAMAEAGL
jgi:anthranilate synthase component I